MCVRVYVEECQGGDYTQGGGLSMREWGNGGMGEWGNGGMGEWGGREMTGHGVLWYFDSPC